MTRTLSLLASLAAPLLFVLPGPALAAPRHILLVNDDGLTSNLIALYAALKTRGDDVIVSVPCHNQSGMGTALNLKPPARLTTACRADAAAADSPPAGPMTRPGLPAGDFHYVDGTPTMALLYGLDMLAPARWHGLPDLVISGPNEGRNTGPSILASGTVSAVRFALVRGVPAMAVSAGSQTADDEGLANPASLLIAHDTAALVSVLEQAADGGPLIPAGHALNVNFPDRLEGARWRPSRIGTYDSYTVKMVADPLGARLSLGTNPAPPAAAQAQDEAAVARDAIAVSLIEGDVRAPAGSRIARWLKKVLGSL